MDLSVPLASGRTADVYALGPHRVLRRYRDGAAVAAEAAIMRYVGERGFPVPAVYTADGTDLVMERLDGATLLVALGRGEIAVEPAARILAELHRGLHALPPRLSTDPGARILHLDLHPDNVVLSSRGPVLIDWRNATEGPPDLDVALSALIFAQVAVDVESGQAPTAEALLHAFLADVGGGPLRQIEQAVALRRGDPQLSGEEIGRLVLAAALVRRSLEH